MKKWMNLITIGLIFFSAVVIPNVMILYVKLPSTSCGATTYSFLTTAICFGGNNSDSPQAYRVDSMGLMYISGMTSSYDFPLLNAYDSIYESGNIFVTKLNTDTSLNFSTFFGSGYVNGMDVDDKGSCYITGYTDSSAFPILNAYNSIHTGEKDVFVSKFNPEGTLNFSTFLGGSGSDYGIDITVDRLGACYITGITFSSDFPIYNGENTTYSGDADIFITKFNTNGSLNYSIFLGGSQYDAGGSVTVDEFGNCYLSGYSRSPDFPTVNPFDTSLNGDSDSIITILNSDGTLNFSSYFGGNSEDGGGNIRVGEDGCIYIEGGSTSSDLPSTYIYRGITDNWGGKPWYSYILKLNANRELEFCTELDRHTNDLHILDDNSVYIGGNILESEDFFTQYEYDNTLGGNFDCSLSKLNPDGTLNFSTYIGGNSNDGSIGMEVSETGEILLCGSTKSMDFPIELTDPLDANYDIFIIGLYEPCVDSDSDGILNYWEVQNHLDMMDPLDANYDPDEDGLTNLMEFRLGTNPHDADTDDDGFRDGRDADPFSFLVPTGIIIITVGISSGIASFTFIAVRTKSKRKKIETQFEKIERNLQNAQYGDALEYLDTLLPSIEKSRGKLFRETWNRLYTRAERSLKYNEEFLMQKKLIGTENDKQICENLIQLLKTANNEPHTDSIDRKIYSDISDLIDELSKKGSE